MRTTCSRSKTKILPSPILPVFADFSIASITRSVSPSSTAASIFTLGRKSTTYSAPRYSSVWPFWRPKPLTSVTVMPCTPMPERASRTSSSLNGLMMAVTSFMSAPLETCRSEVLLHTHDEARPGEVLVAATGQVVGEAEMALPVGAHHAGAQDEAAEFLGHGDRVIHIGAEVLDALPADVRHDRVAAAHVEGGAQVEVAAALTVGRAE